MKFISMDDFLNYEKQVGKFYLLIQTEGEYVKEGYVIYEILQKYGTYVDTPNAILYNENATGYVIREIISIMGSGTVNNSLKNKSFMSMGATRHTFRKSLFSKNHFSQRFKKVEVYELDNLDQDLDIMLTMRELVN